MIGFEKRSVVSTNETNRHKEQKAAGTYFMVDEEDKDTRAS